MSKLTIGSLFSGIGGFEYIASLYGIEPVWASEIEEAPIRITKRHFPNMKHYGDITKMNGAEIEPVDIISGGSPCQSISCAGHQDGIKKKCPVCNTLLPIDFSDDACPKCGAEIEYTRSGLFMEQIRLIKEMRRATDNTYPKVAVWENVCFTEDNLVTCENGFKKISEVHIGDKVKTLSGKYHTVTRCHKTKHQPIMELKVSGSLPTKVTPNHPFYVREKSYNSSNVRFLSDPIWLPAKDLTSNHLVGYRLDIPELPDDFMSEIDAWLVGRWLADGSVDLKKSTPRIFISVGNKKIESVRNKVKESVYNIHENRVHETAVNFTFTSRDFYNYIADAGIGAANKRVPAYVFKLPYKLQQCVLLGYISGDGFTRDNDCGSIRLTASTASKDLAFGIARLIRNVYHTPISMWVSHPNNPVIDGRSLSVNHPTYSIETTIGAKYSLSYFDGDFVWQPVKSIEPLPNKETVYNISVLEDNTYEINEIICHNCGALSSNNGDDFAVVLSEFLGLLGEKLPTLRPEKWTNAGEIVADKGSLAWRLFDAQYWGVPQRRRRIYLVLDFTGQRAGEILFKSESLRRHTPQSEVPWKRTPRKTENSIGAADSKLGEVKPLAVATQQVNAEIMEDVSPTLTAANGTSGSNKTYVVLNDQGGSVMDVSENITGTLRAETHGHTPVIIDDSADKEVYGICSMASNCMKSDNPDSGIYKADVSKTLDTSGTNPTCNQGGNVVVEPVYCIQGNCIDRADTAGCNGKGWKEDVAYTLTTIDRPAVAYAVHENGDAAVWLSDHAQALTTGGGKIGQGYSAVLVETEDPQCAAFLGKQSESAGGIGYDEKVSPTLVAGGPPQVAVYDQVPFAESDFVGFNEGKFATLKASGGHIGGGSETLVAGFAYQVGPNIPHLPYNEEKSPTLVANQQMGVLIDNHGQDCRWRECNDGVCPTLAANMGMGGNNMPLYVDDVAVSATVGGFNGHKQEEVAQTLLSRDYKDPQIVLLNHISDPIYLREVDNYVTTTRNPILRLLWETYGAKAIVQWGIDVLATLQQAEVLRQRVHETGIQIQTQNRHKLDDGTLVCSEVVAYWLLRDVRVNEECRCTPQGRESTEQQYYKFDEIMSELSHQDSPQTEVLFRMWSEGKGTWVLQQTLFEIQEVWKSICSKTWRKHSIVRRLTPTEAERLQGFPDNWTAEESDTARYKALGNSVALPCVNYVMSGIADILDPIK